MDSNQMREDSQRDNRYIEFSLGSQNFGVSLLKVKEVVAPPPTTPIPFSPPYFVGIMNLRGQVISVMDLRKKLGVQASDLTEENAVIIVEVVGTQIGLLVDSINCVLSPEEGQIAPPDEVVKGTKRDFVEGMYKKENDFSILLNIEAVLDLQDINVLKGKQAA